METLVNRHDSPATAPSLWPAVRALLWAIAVLAASAVTLCVADALPGVVRDTARGVVRYGTIDEVERVVGRRLPTPAYYPAALEWPPGDLRVYLGKAAAYWCRTHDRGTLALIVAVTPPGDRALAAAVLPRAVVLQEADGMVGGRVARVTRLSAADGALWHQVEWAGTRGVIVARSRGTLEELMLIVSSLRE
jgi:hypothetical protein